MVKCRASPDCLTEFKVFNTAELMLLKGDLRMPSSCGLCPASESLLIPCVDSEGDVSVKARVDGEHRQPSHLDRRLRRIRRFVEHTPWLRDGRARGLTLPGAFQSHPFSASSEAA